MTYIGEMHHGSSFQQQCVLALTHPLTVSAVALLLLNDLLFKSLWTGSWVTGKLSDLAWVVFAPPLLALGLSLFIRSKPHAERVALLVAYLGLPLLYAAFNSLEPVHDWILRGLWLARGGIVGGPLDPTDSLVIPIGLAIAVWVWCRSTSDTPSLRARLGLLTGAIAVLATVSSTPADIPDPQWGVGTQSNGTLIANLADPHVSEDGGLTWTALDIEISDSRAMDWGASQVDTPRGIYVVEDQQIVRIADGSREVVYSAAQLNDAANRRFRQVVARAPDDTCFLNCVGYEDPPVGLNTMVYHRDTGNVVVAAGLQGAVVGDAEGNWSMVAVGGLAPIDFSLGNKLGTVFRNETLWLAAIALSVSAISGTLIVLALARAARRRHMFRNIIIAIAVALGLPGIWIGLGLSEFVWLFDHAAVSGTALAITAIVWVAAMGSLGLGGGIVNMVYSTAASVTAAILVFTGQHINRDASLLDAELPTLLIPLGLFFGAVAFFISKPPLSQLPVIIAAFLLAVGLIAFATMIGVLQGFQLGYATAYAFGFVILLCVLLGRQLRGSESTSE